MNPDQAARLSSILRQAVAILDEIADSPAAPATSEWSSRDLPPGVSLETFRRTCAELKRKGEPGVRKDGQKWFIDRTTWTHHRDRPRRPQATVTTDVAVDAIVSKMRLRSA